MSASLSIVPEYHTCTGSFPRVTVDLTDERAVSVTFEAKAGETFDDRDFSRTFTAAEARALAAALTHFAEEASRP